MTTADDLDYDPAVEIAQEEIATYIRIGLATLRAGLGNAADEPPLREALQQIEHLQLAEPWLPAVSIVRRLRAAGLAGNPDKDGDE